MKIKSESHTCLPGTHHWESGILHQRDHCVTWLKEKLKTQELKMVHSLNP
jgi:hypothetical protein